MPKKVVMVKQGTAPKNRVVSKPRLVVDKIGDDVPAKVLPIKTPRKK